MKLIDILIKSEKKEKGRFRFYINYDPIASERNAINWIYNDGEIMTEDYSDNIFYHLKNSVYSLSDEIVIIQEPLDKLESLKEFYEELNKFVEENRTRYIYQDGLGEDWRFEDLDVYRELLKIIDKVKIEGE